MIKFEKPVKPEAHVRETLYAVLRGFQSCLFGSYLLLKIPAKTFKSRVESKIGGLDILRKPVPKLRTASGGIHFSRSEQNTCRNSEVSSSHISPVLSLSSRENMNH